MPTPARLVLFDGDCSLCNSAVRFITARDPRLLFAFARLDSDAARARLEREGLSPAALGDTMVLIEGSRIFVRSAAALRIARRLRLPWPALWAFMVVPACVRDRVYDMIARRRRHSRACAAPRGTGTGAVG